MRWDSTGGGDEVGEVVVRDAECRRHRRPRRQDRRAEHVGERLDDGLEALGALETTTAGDDDAARPKWLRFLRSLLSGIYTIDNLDFVLRDSYMSGYSPRAFDLDRLLHYSFFTPQGLTIHSRGLSALVRFISVRSELFRSLYFHRTVRALDLTLADLFAESRELLFQGNPAERLNEYQRFTEWSLLIDVAHVSPCYEYRDRRPDETVEHRGWSVAAADGRGGSVEPQLGEQAVTRFGERRHSSVVEQLIRNQ